MWPLNNEHRGSWYSVNKQNLFLSWSITFFWKKHSMGGERHNCELLACVASVSSRVIARKLELEQKRKNSFICFLLSSQLSRRTRAETLAMQASELLVHNQSSPLISDCIFLHHRAWNKVKLSTKCIERLMAAFNESSPIENSPWNNQKVAAQ